MSDNKTMNHNTLLLKRFFDVFGISPYSIKNQNYAKELVLYVTMAAYKFNELLHLTKGPYYLTDILIK